MHESPSRGLKSKSFPEVFASCSAKSCLVGRGAGKRTGDIVWQPILFVFPCNSQTRGGQQAASPLTANSPAVAC
eukprot:12956006-Alexandrium_andersonii.AAC.1